MAAAAVERSNASPVKGTFGHGLGLGSGSGAAGWLSGSTSSLGGSIDSVEREVGASVGRKYHIPAVEAAKASSATPDDLFLRLNPSGSGDVDLDLSFDFVSQLENTRRTAVQTPVYEKSEASATERTSPSPKGMSTAKRWGSRAKKQPPAALPMLKKKQLLAATDLTSQFSPISPLDHKRDHADEEPLTISRLGASRRAADSGIQSRMNTSAPVQEVDRATLIRQQRSNALRKQQQQQEQPQRNSPEKKMLKGNVSPKKRVALGENKAKNNMQIGQVEEIEDIFDDATYDYQKHLTKSISLASTKTGGLQSSFATAHESNTGRSKKGRPMPADSMDSLNTFNTADSVDGVEAAISTGNMLGLDLVGGGAPMDGAGLGLTVPQDANNSPLSTQQSSPGTPFSPMFSDSDTNKGSEYTNGAPSEGATTPGTAFSTLFDERQLEIKGPGSAAMLRGPSAPVSAKPLVKDVIEEERASLVRAHTEPRSSFTASLPSDDYKESRSLHHDHSADASSSDLGSSPIKGKQQMVLSTADSMTDDAKFLFRQPNLHGQERTKGEEASNALGLGLGIDMGQMDEGSSHHFMGDLSVERAMLSTDIALDLGLAMTKDDTMLASQSFTSSADGFAINITPAGYKSQAPELRIDVPAALDERSLEDRTSKQDEQSKGRWSSKLWSMASKSPLSPFRPSSRTAGDDQERTPTMKSLTLVDRRNVDNGPLSAPLPSQAVFNPSLPVPAQAWHSESQDGTSHTRASRIRYLTNDDGHVRVNLKDDQEATSTSEVATPASALTPKMEYIMSVRSQRHSWAYSSDAGFSGTPSWLSAAASAEKKSENQTQTRQTLLRNSTLSAVAADAAAGENMLHPTLETITEDGIRRRVRHRATNSVPTSPFMVPDSWTSPNPEASNAERPEEKARARFHGSQNEQQQSATRRRRTKTLGSRMSIFGPASISITPYLTGLTGSRYRSRMVKATSLKPSVYSKADGQTQIRLFSDDRGPVEGLFAYSGRALENASPSRSLFFAGFLAMPWLWFIGGWGLENDGSVYIEKDIFWDQSDEAFSHFERERQQSLATKALFASGRRLSRASTLPTHRSSVLHDDPYPAQNTNHGESVIDMGQETYTSERPYSFIARSSWMVERAEQQEDQQITNRRARSLLLGEERKSVQPITLDELRSSVILANYQQQGAEMHAIDLGQQNDDDQNVGIAYSTHDHSSVTAHPSYAQQADFAAAAAQLQSQSQWEEYDESKDKMQKDKKKGILGATFLQQVFAANTTMMAKLATASARVSDNSSMRSSLKNRRRQRESVFTQVQPQSQLLSAFTNWSSLERFVLLNRIMALTISLVVFGAAGIAIGVVINDW